MKMEHKADTPFLRSYWVSPGKLLAGHYPGDKDPHVRDSKLDGLLDCGIRAAVNLMEPGERGNHGELYDPYEEVLVKKAEERGLRVTTYRFSIRDLSVTSDEHMRRILDTIDAESDKGRAVYVHCRGGIGRTGTVVGCYMIEHGIASGEDIFRTIAEHRKDDPYAYIRSPETQEQRDMVLRWEKDNGGPRAVTK